MSLKNTFSNHSLFLAQVTAVYYTRTVSKTAVGVEVIREPGTIDIQPTGGRNVITNIKVLVPNTANVNGKQYGFIWLPNVNDWVVCTYLEGYPDFPVCLGAIYHPQYNRVSEEGQVLKDFVIHHQSDSFVRLREPSPGKSVVTIKHNTGTSIEIDEDGNVNIDTSEKISLNSNTIELNGTEQKAMLGDLFKQVFDKLVQAFNSHTQIGNLGFPTAPPTTPFTDTTNYLSDKVKLG